MQTHKHTAHKSTDTCTYPHDRYKHTYSYQHTHAYQTNTHTSTHIFTQPLSLTCVCAQIPTPASLGILACCGLVPGPSVLLPGCLPSLGSQDSNTQACSHLGLCAGLPSARRPSLRPLGSLSHSILYETALYRSSLPGHPEGPECLLSICHPASCHSRCRYLHNSCQCSLHVETSFVFSVSPLTSRITCDT